MKLKSKAVAAPRHSFNFLQAFVCIEFENMEGEKHNSENDVDNVVPLRRYCIQSFTLL